MANSYNSNPIIYDTDTVSNHSWRGDQTLNTGQWGIQITGITLHANGTTAAGTVQIIDPKDSTVYWEAPVATGQAGTTIVHLEDIRIPCRDFKVTGVTATVTKLLIWYKA